MRKKSTRLLSAALAACMMLSVLPVGAFAAEPGAEEQENGASAQADSVDSEFVEINDTNFPDPVFQQYVKDNIDTADTTSGQKDGRLSKAERDAVTTISIDNQNCTDLTGIAYFANLTTLRCQQNGLKELNLEYNKNLTNLNCSYNKLTTLDVSKNAKLSTLECTNNGMEELNLGDITSLKHLFCSENNLTELDVSKNRYLEQLHCRYNNLRRLVIGNNYSLTMLYLLGNHLTSLDLYHKSEIWNYDYATQSYTIDVNDDGTFDLDSLPKGFDASKTTDWEGGTRVGNTLNVNSHEVQYGVKQDDPTNILTTPDENDPTKVTFTMPDANVEVTATFAEDPIPEPDPVGPSDTGNIQGAISAVVIGAAAGAIIYEAGTGIYRVINMPGIPMPSNRIELAELLWEHAGKPEPVSTALYSDIDEGDTDAQKAARWAVEQDLMKDDADNNKFHPAFPVSKLRTCLTWNAAKEKGLFDKTEE